MNGDIIPPNRSGNQNGAGLPAPVPTANNSSSGYNRPATGQVNRNPQASTDNHSQYATREPSMLPQPVVSDAPKPKRRLWPWVAGLVVGLVVTTIVGSAAWYQTAIRPLDASDNQLRSVNIAPGSTPQVIGSQLQGEGIIRSGLAFSIYTRLEGVGGSLQAGNFSIAPSSSVSEIVSILMQAEASSFNITFYPGATLYDPTDIADNRRTDAYTMLVRAGFSESEARSALEKQYDHPLFAGKPADANLEGYVFGETYQFDKSATAEEVLVHTFDVFYERIEAAGVLTRLAEYDFTLYEAMTLASIIEREVSGQADDQKIVSQIFHKRLNTGQPLGADATFMYAAQQQNVTPRINLESPYNTRINTGLPPGPIASPSIAAIEAAVNPADTDYLYFVSGDDGTNHFARTNQEHVENTRRYCTTLCNEIAN